MISLYNADNPSEPYAIPKVDHRRAVVGLSDSYMRTIIVGKDNCLRATISDSLIEATRLNIIGKRKFIAAGKPGLKERRRRQLYINSRARYERLKAAGLPTYNPLRIKKVYSKLQMSIYKSILIISKKESS
jgi:hypothetical protein